MQSTNTVQTSERDAEAFLSKASKAEFAKKYDQAFQLYIKTAESFLYLSRMNTTNDKNKLKWKASAAKALERAEKIKKFVDKSRSSLNPGAPSPDQIKVKGTDIRLTPVGINHFSHQEQFYVLRKGGTVNGIFFPLWDDPVVVDKGSTAAIYSDPDGQPKLSPEQQKVSPTWRRLITSPAPEAKQSPRRILPQEILQHIVTDCSVCASVSVCLEHGRRFGSSLESSIHNGSELQNTSNQTYQSHSLVEGRYDVRVLFNGAWRRIVIDDRLPLHPTEGTLMCMSVARPCSESFTYDTLWPSLLEKAYMKLMGGYDFPGSNSSIDLHTLAGWIPEHIEMKSSTFEREKTWERIEKGFSAGHCVVTLGTGPSSYIQWKDVPFLPSHSYAVIDVYEAEDGRIFTVLDSWFHANGSKEASRVLHIPWSEIVNTFDGVYLSWDPKIWQTPLTFHGMWKRQAEGDDGGSRQVQIEFSNQDNADDEIWILLTRHVFDAHQTSEYISLRVDVDDLNKEANVTEQQALYTKGTYTNSTHILSRTRVPKSQRSGVLSISASCDGEAREVGFTLTAYAKANMKISWIERKSLPPFTQKVEGSFTSKTGGGNCTYSSFMVNPQYSLIVHPIQGQQGREQNKARITLTLRTNKDIPVNVAMVWSQGKRVTELSATDLVATSGAYSYGLARLAKTITVGEYNIVVSAFEPFHIGPFSLNIESSHPFDVKPIPQEGAGMYCKIVRGSWEGETAAGGPSFEKYSQNPTFTLEIPSAAQVLIRLQLLHPSTFTALNITVYPDSSSKGSAPLSLERQKHIATSGAYDDAIAGVVTQQMTLAAGRYYVVPSTYNPGVELSFRMLVYSSVSGFKVTEVQRSHT